MSTGSNEQLIRIMVEFLTEIGIRVRAGELRQPTVVPGIHIEAGGLLIDEGKLLYPGDLLHEGGHIAIVPPSRRGLLNGSVGTDLAEEMMAMAWSYAASVHLKLPPEVVFHPGGYRGGSAAMIECFTSGGNVGLPMLQWVGMALDARRAAEAGERPFPHMQRWLREMEPPVEEPLPPCDEATPPSTN